MSEGVAAAAPSCCVVASASCKPSDRFTSPDELDKTTLAVCDIFRLSVAPDESFVMGRNRFS